MKGAREFALSAFCVALSTSASGQPAREAPPPFTLKPVHAGQAPPNPYSKAQTAHGKMLVFSNGCKDCHTPGRMDSERGVPVPDWSRLLSGHPEGAPDPQGELGPGENTIMGSQVTRFTYTFRTQ